MHPGSRPLADVAAPEKTVLKTLITPREVAGIRARRRFSPDRGSTLGLIRFDGHLMTARALPAAPGRFFASDDPSNEGPDLHRHGRRCARAKGLHRYTTTATATRLSGRGDTDHDHGNGHRRMVTIIAKDRADPPRRAPASPELKVAAVTCGHSQTPYLGRVRGRIPARVEIQAVRRGVVALD